MVLMAVVALFCFTLAAYAQEDKTEAAKIQAIADAEAMLQPLEDNVSILWKKMFEDRQVKWEEMKSLNAAIEKYENELEAANQHLSIYDDAKLPNRLYLSTREFNKFYFQGAKYGHLDQPKMRLIAAKEGVDLQKIEKHVNPATQGVSWLGILLCAGILLLGLIKKSPVVAALGFGLMAATSVSFLIIISA